MKYFVFLILFIFLNITYIKAQNDKHSHLKHKCGNVEYMNKLKSEDPQLSKRISYIENFVQNWIKENRENLNQTKNIITIPVVVHIVYFSPIENVPYENILSQINILNEDFRNNNSEIPPDLFSNVDADCEIDFCLARVDPAGIPTSGVTRTQTTIFEFSGDKVKFTAQGGKDIWDRDKYLNIWVCQLSSGMLGYSPNPGVSPEVDGVVIDYRAFGSLGDYLYADYNQGRSCVHEIGHWLNLFHIWGDDGGACEGDQNAGSDEVPDTPDQADANYGCVRFPHPSCTNISDMFMNYMDYSNDECLYLFTKGQRARMRAILNGPRVTLQSSMACQNQALFPIADFEGDSLMINQGESASFTDISGDASITDWWWVFHGGKPAISNDQNPQNIVFNKHGMYSVSLSVKNNYGYSHSRKIKYIHVLNTTIRYDFYFYFSKYEPSVLNIGLYNDFENVKINVYNIMGQKVAQAVFNEVYTEEVSLDFKSLIPETYIIQVVTDKYALSKKTLWVN